MASSFSNEIFEFLNFSKFQKQNFAKISLGNGNYAKFSNENSGLAKNKLFLVLIFILILIISFVGSVYAITGTIGNGRMILRANTGDLIKKSILVKNVNNVSVNIELSSSGDLEKDVVIKDNNFLLEPGSEKDAKFEIKVKNEGTTETKINVKFTSLEEKQGVILSSNVVIIAGKGDDDSGSNFSSKTIVFISTGIIIVVLAILLAISYIKKKKGAEKGGEVKLKKSAGKP